MKKYIIIATLIFYVPAHADTILWPSYDWSDSWSTSPTTSLSWTLLNDYSDSDYIFYQYTDAQESSLWNPPPHKLLHQPTATFFSYGTLSIQLRARLSHWDENCTCRVTALGTVCSDPIFSLTVNVYDQDSGDLVGSWFDNLTVSSSFSYYGTIFAGTKTSTNLRTEVDFSYSGCGISDGGYLRIEVSSLSLTYGSESYWRFIL